MTLTCLRYRSHLENSLLETRGEYKHVSLYHSTYFPFFHMNLSVLNVSIHLETSHTENSQPWKLMALHMSLFFWHESIEITIRFASVRFQKISKNLGNLEISLLEISKEFYHVDISFELPHDFHKPEWERERERFDLGSSLLEPSKNLFLYLLKKFQNFFSWPCDCNMLKKRISSQNLTEVKIWRITEWYLLAIPRVLIFTTSFKRTS